MSQRLIRVQDLSDAIPTVKDILSSILTDVRFGNVRNWANTTERPLATLSECPELYTCTLSHPPNQIPFVPIDGDVTVHRVGSASVTVVSAVPTDHESDGDLLVYIFVDYMRFEVSFSKKRPAPCTSLLFRSLGWRAAKGRSRREDQISWRVDADGRGAWLVRQNRDATIFFARLDLGSILNSRSIFIWRY